MFFDEVTLELEGGRGGNGAVFFHREKYVDVGYPDGGNGGNGGNLVLETDENHNTLQHFTGLKYFKAPAGENGFKNDMAGKAGEDLVLKVPVGTLVRDCESKEILMDFTEHGQHYSAARGGRGGYGNGHFVSSTRQAPDFAELGDSGEYKKVQLELQLIADVGLLGFPSAGKSTLISHVSSARPKIAAYPFTTLVPNLGVVYLSDFGGDPEESFVIADMPGIIEGASEGKGLGDSFLKHISRTAILLYILDPFSYESRSLSEQYTILKNELKKYNPELVKKDFLVLINKIDSIPEEDRTSLGKELLKGQTSLKPKLRWISGVSGEGLPSLLFELYDRVQKQKKKSLKRNPKAAKEVMQYQPKDLQDEAGFKVEKLKRVKTQHFEEPIHGRVIEPELIPERTLFKVSGKRIEQISRMTNTEQAGALRRVEDVMEKMGIKRALLKAGAGQGDYIKIGPHIFEFHNL